MHLIQTGALSALAICATLAGSAVAEDWPHFLGPQHDATSRETRLLKAWPKDGPRRLWEHEKGEGWACPAIVGERLVLFSRREEREVIECLHAQTGAALWEHDYAAPYTDRMGTGEGPRTSPAIAAGRVFTYGVTAQLRALDLTTGTVLWTRDLAADFSPAPNFFGAGSTPLVLGSRVIVQVGGTDDACVVGFDAASGKTLWTAKHAWPASYSSPIPATLHGRACVLVFAGGESDPSTGGLLTIDAATGEVLNTTPHRSDMVQSVNASSPAVAGERVFVTEAYGAGGAMIEIAPDFSAEVAWRAPKLGAQFMTPVVRDGRLHGFDGQHARLAELVCHDIATGKELWRDDLGGKFGKGSLLAADGAFLALGEFGDLAWLDLTAKGATVLAKAKLFHAAETWTLPALSGGRLYVCQNSKSADGKTPRLICHDLRTTPP